MNWKAWLIGLANAVLSGVTGGGAAMYVGLNWKKGLAVAGACAWMSFSKWIAQHPLPGTEAGLASQSKVAAWPGGPVKQ